MGGWVWEPGKGFKHQTWPIGAVLGVGTDVFCWSPSLITDTYWVWGASYEPPQALHSGQARDMLSRGQRSKPLLTTIVRGSVGCRICPQQPDVWGRTVLRGYKPGLGCQARMHRVARSGGKTEVHTIGCISGQL